MNNFTKRTFTIFAALALPVMLFAQSTHGDGLRPVPKDVLPIVKHTKTLSVNEISKTDFSGDYTGQRFQYTENKKAILRTYTYTMHIVQSGANVSGTTRITANNGDFAEIKLRGLVIQDKLYFEEYEIVDQQKSDGALWCFKVGELQMGVHDQNTVIYGPTNSYTSMYYSPCTGGYTMLEKVSDKNAPNTPVITKEPDGGELTNMAEESKFALEIYPNPFVTETNVNYTTAKESKVNIELYNISGVLIKTITNEVQTPGSHHVSVNGNNLAAGVYVVKINIDGEVTSKQIIKTSN